MGWADPPLSLERQRPADGGSKRRAWRRCWWIAAVLALLCAASGFGQQAAPAAKPVPTGAPGPAPIAAADISDQAIATGGLLRNVSAELAADQDLEAIRDEYTAGEARLDALQQETLQRLREEGPTSVLEETETEWIRVEARLDSWLKPLKSRVDALNSLLDNIHGDKARWELTRDALTADLPPASNKTIRDTLATTAGVEQRLQSARDTTLSLQATIGQQKADAEEILADLSGEIARRRLDLFSIDSPPLWRVFTAEDKEGTAPQAATSWREGYSAVRSFLVETGARLLGQFGLFALLVTGLIALGRRARAGVEQDRSLESTVSLLKRPIAAALVLSLPLLGLTQPTAPAAWRGVLSLVLLMAALRLVPPLVGPSRRNWIYPLGSLLLVWAVAQATPPGSLLNRLTLLLLCLLGALASAWFARKVDPDASGGARKWLRAIEVGARVAGGLFLVAAIANVVGSVDLATLIASGMLYATFGALLVLLMALLLKGLVRIGLLTRTARHLGFVRSRAETVRATLFRLIRWLAVIAWISAVLSGFLVIYPVVSFFRSVLGAEISIGKLGLSPADVLVFILVIWVSFKLSQLIQFVLDADVLPHMHLPRGAPAAITKLTHYAVMVIGVMIAFSAAGFDLSRISIIFGALSVGIGFGLQNVVNNFVSGFILLFERPIKVGDVIQLDTTLGVVKNIAMRASTVRTYEGAEIIVPNANLISAEVVNWTYSDDQRRIQIPVGVAYGTDPARVIELLVEVAKKQPEVSETPAPEALFVAHGDSSLDFQLRVWTSTDSYMQVGSALRVGITQALTEAGIEIPFPQRDLHLRSTAEGIPLGADSKVSNQDIQHHLKVSSREDG